MSTITEKEKKKVGNSRHTGSFPRCGMPFRVMMFLAASRANLLMDVTVELGTF